ncbi:hypothetical protein TRAPUB_7092 [Trametes pubescens]|uniref:Uncharacterized protein n=1 Tax=Trametes pubescens TaxID=154538 RepID=A0A1M2V458_TRAPU|nr:hypothetical protein TRAPUB_7092 [Trametes pubescens]
MRLMSTELKVEDNPKSSVKTAVPAVPKKMTGTRPHLSENTIESVSAESEAALEALRRCGDEWAVMAACWKG